MRPWVIPEEDTCTVQVEVDTGHWVLGMGTVDNRKDTEVGSARVHRGTLEVRRRVEEDIVLHLWGLQVQLQLCLAAAKNLRQKVPEDSWSPCPGC